MPKYKKYNYNQTRMLPIDFNKQILPGSFEHTVSYLIDNELDLTIFNDRYHNDATGRPAYDPAILLKIVLAAYSRGVTSSRDIESLCRENIIFMALSADSSPHFTTIADFISRMSEIIAPLFLQVLMTCDGAGLIGKEMFAIDGCKLPTNASKEWSGTHAELTKKQKKIDRAVRRMLKKHRDEDQSGGVDLDLRERGEQQIEKLRAVSKKIKKHLATTTDKIGHRGQAIKSNITDNDSAKMKTSHGVIQGYVGVAAVDHEHQVIVSAQAFGEAQEHRLLTPVVEAIPGDWQRKAKAKKRKYFTPEDFSFDDKHETLTCPAGKSMWLSMRDHVMGARRYLMFQGYLKDCRVCPVQSRCLRKPPGEHGRQVAIRVGRAEKVRSVLQDMQTKIDSDRGRHIYHQRIGTVEPVFGNITTTIGLNRFTLRSKPKVNAQWMTWCMVHNIGKLQRYSDIALR